MYSIMWCLSVHQHYNIKCAFTYSNEGIIKKMPSWPQFYSQEIKRTESGQSSEWNILSRIPYVYNQTIKEPIQLPVAAQRAQNRSRRANQQIWPGKHLHSQGGVWSHVEDWTELSICWNLLESSWYCSPNLATTFFNWIALHSIFN